MNKKKKEGGGGGVTTANESCWWRRAWRWGTWKRLVNASETSRSQTGHVACFNTPWELLKLSLSLCLCFFFSCISIFLPGTHLGLCVVNLCTSCQTFSLVCLCALCDTVQSGERPPRQHTGHGQTVLGNQGWSLAVVMAVRPAACVSLTLSCWVCLVSGTSFSIHLLLPSLIFKLTTPYPLLSFFPVFPICKKLFHKHL